VQAAEELGSPDLIILPGTKNTIEDLLFIRRSGIEAEIKRLHSKGTAVFGICGGYQMLGTWISDPDKTESSLIEIEGMCLLNLKTVFKAKKTTTRVEASITDDSGLLEGLKGMKVKGYEIHMGTSEYGPECVPYINIERVLDRETRQTDGVRSEDGIVFGTYIHGIFDNMEFTRGFINNLRKKKGLEISSTGVSSFNEFKETQYDLLADMLRTNLDMKKLYAVMGIV